MDKPRPDPSRSRGWASLQPSVAHTLRRRRGTSRDGVPPSPKLTVKSYCFQCLTLRQRVEDNHGSGWEKSMCRLDHCISARRHNSFGARLMMALTWRAMIAVLVSTMQAPASAKTEVEGRSDAVRLSAEDASVNEVLAALSARFNLTYTPAPELDRAVAGGFFGAFQQRFARIPAGYDYVAQFFVNGSETKGLWRSGALSRPSDSPSL